MQIRMHLSLSVVVFLLLGGSASADVSLPAILSDHMVLQRETELPIWGWADPGEEVTISIAGQTHRIAADASGAWRVVLEPLGTRSTPIELKVSGKNALVLRDILVGEVWLASGQSNMQFSLAATDTASEELPRADYPMIRLFNVPRLSSLESQSDTSARWEVCTPASAAGFSAAAYFFGRELSRELDVPVGLIGSSWGGTNAEEWTAREWLEKDFDFKPILERWDDSPPEVKGLFRTPPFVEMEIDDLAFLPLDPTQPELLLDNFSDEDLWTALFGLWENQSSVPESTLEIVKSSEAGSQYLRLTGKTRVGSNVQLEVRYAPGRVIDLSHYRGIRMRMRGRGTVRFHSLQPTVTDSDNFTAALIPLTPEWQTVTLAFDDLKQAGWGKRQPFSRDSLKGAVFEVLPTAQPVSRPPSGLFNGMIRPLVPVGIRGVIWYQGEGNAGRAYQYRGLLPAMIDSWRKAWGREEMRFLIVQLPNFRSRKAEPSASDWAELREAQLLTHRNVRNSGLAVTIDLGEPDDVHPRSKIEVGRRLAAWALGEAYGRRQVYSGPLFSRFQAEGDRVRVWFDHVGTGLVAAGGEDVKGFAIAAADQRFRWARARIDGDTVVVWSEEVGVPVAVRYAWADNPDCNLYNREGFPASPFRTDNWPGVTSGRR